MADTDRATQAAPQYLTVAEVAQRLTTSEKFVRREIANGALPARKFGTAVRIKISDVVAYEDGDQQTYGHRPR